MISNELSDFCLKNEIDFFKEPINVKFASRRIPKARGFVIGFSKDGKIAITMGPEIKTVFVVSIKYFAENVENCAANCKYFKCYIFTIFMFKFSDSNCVFASFFK